MCEALLVWGFSQIFMSVELELVYPVSDEFIKTRSYIKASECYTRYLLLFLFVFSRKFISVEL